MKRQTRFELLTGVHTCALPISKPIWTPKKPKLIFHRPAKPCRGLSMLLSPSAGRRLSSGEGVAAWRGESKRVGVGYTNTLQGVLSSARPAEPLSLSKSRLEGPLRGILRDGSSTSLSPSSGQTEFGY